MRLIGFEEHPRYPGYGSGTWEDGHRTDLSPLNQLSQAYQEGLREIQAKNDAEKTAQADAPSGLSSDEQKVMESLDPNTRAILARDQAQRPDVQPVAMPPSEAQGPSGQQMPGEQAPAGAGMNDLLMQSAGEALRARKYVPGRPGRNPQLEAQMRSPVPLSRMIETTPGVPYDQDALRQTQDLQRKAMLMRGQADVLTAKADVTRQNRMADLEFQKYQDQQAHQAKVEQEYSAQMGRLNQEAEALAKQQPDRNRAGQSVGFGRGIILAIAAGLQSYANGGGSSQTLEYLQREFADDIAAQEQQLRDSRGAVKNQLAELAQRWGSVEAGRSALLATKWSAAERVATAQAAQIGVPRAQAAAAAMAADFQAQQAEQRRVLEQAARGNVTVREQQEMAMPQAAKPGYWADALNPQQKFGIMKDLVNTLVQNGLTEAQAAKAAQEAIGLRQEQEAQQQGAAGPLKPAELRAGVKELNAQVMEKAKGLAEIDRVLNQLKITKDPRTGQYRPPEGGIPGIGYGLNLGPLASNQAKSNQAALKSIQMDMVVNAIGAARDDKQIEDLVNYINSGGDEQSIASLLGNIRERAVNAQTQVEQGFDQRIVNAHKANASFDAGAR